MKRQTDMSLGGAGTCMQGGPLRPQAGKRCTARPPHPRSPGGVPSVAARQAIACGPRAETGGTERSCGRGGLVSRVQGGGTCLWPRIPSCGHAASEWVCWLAHEAVVIRGRAVRAHVL